MNSQETNLATTQLLKKLKSLLQTLSWNVLINMKKEVLLFQMENM